MIGRGGRRELESGGWRDATGAADPQARAAEPATLAKRVALGQGFLALGGGALAVGDIAIGRLRSTRPN